MKPASPKFTFFLFAFLLCCRALIAADVPAGQEPGGVPAEIVPAKAPLVVQAPAEWTVEYKGDKGFDTFILRRPGPEFAALMFSRMPVQGTRDQIPGWLDGVAQIFLKKAKENPKIKLESETYVTGKIDGEEFSGESALFTVQDGMCQVMFMISSGEGVWTGQFVGKTERWDEALGVLKTLKKN